MTELKERLTAYLALLVMALLVAAFAGPFLILGWQAVTWLKNGYWPSLSASSVLEKLDWPYPTVSWLGVQKLIDWFLALPAAAALPLVGMVCLLVAGAVLSPFQNSRR